MAPSTLISCFALDRLKLSLGVFSVIVEPAPIIVFFPMFNGAIKEEFEPMNEPEPMPQPVADVTQIKEESSSEEEDDTMSYFAKLAKEG